MKTYTDDLKKESLAVLLYLLFTPFSICQDRIGKIDSILTEVYTEGRINGNVLIAEKGQVIYKRSFGFANRTTGEKLNENSVFHLASVTKQFTAMAILILKEQGKLNFDDLITKYLPELEGYEDITIRNLLIHTSGFVDFEQLTDSKDAREYISKNVTGRYITNDDVLAFFKQYKPKLQFKPGTKSMYNDIGFVFLGSIIERISGMSYAEFMNKYIFKPLEMKDTYVNTPGLDLEKITNYARGYIFSQSLNRYQSADSIIKGNSLEIVACGPSDILSSATDLLKWDRALYTEKLVSNASLQTIFKSSALKDNSLTGYGFGWFIREYPAYGKCVFHSGGDRGFAVYIERNIENDKTIIILENIDNGVFPLDHINRQLYNIPFPEEVKLSNEQIQAIEGIYEIKDMGFQLKIWFENERFCAQVTGQKVLNFYAENELTLFRKDIDTKMVFEKNKQGDIRGFYHVQYGNKTWLEKRN